MEKYAGKLISHSCALACLEEVIRGMMLLETFGLRKGTLLLRNSSTAIGY